MKKCGLFVIDKELALTSLEYVTDCNCKKFDELPRIYQRRIKETDNIVHLIQPGTERRAKFNIFRRINTGCAPRTPQEIWQALHQGQTIDHN